MNEIVEFFGQNLWSLWVPLLFIIVGLVMLTEEGAKIILKNIALRQGIKPHITKEGINTYRFYGYCSVIFGIIILLLPYLRTIF